MNTIILTLLLDAGLAALLIATIVYCARLSRRIRLLQDSRGELAEMIARFDHATSRASASLEQLQSVSKKITDAMQLKIEKANFLADDLAFLIERGTKLAAQMEPVKPLSAEPAKAKPAAEPAPVFEAQILKPKPPATPVTPSPSTITSSLEAVLQRLSSPQGAGGGASVFKPSPAPPLSSSLRTAAERELLEALKSGR